MRESRMLGSVGAKPNGRATRPTPGPRGLVPRPRPFRRIGARASSGTVRVARLLDSLQMIPLPAPETRTDAEEVLEAMRAWLEKAVIGLNLCPFAKGVHVGNRIRYVVSDARDPETLRADLARELHTLATADPAEVETTLLIHPWALDDFLDYNDFLDVVDAALEQLGLVGTVQVASFHPRYRFAGAEPDAIENYSNRSPYPMLHLLREESVERAVAGTPDAGRIPERNMETLRQLGLEGWRRLGLFAPPEPAGTIRK